VGGGWTEREKEVKSAKAISDDKAQRLVAWNTDVLARLLKQVVARRSVSHRDRGCRAEAVSG
jgi:hypothetical protein